MKLSIEELEEMSSAIDYKYIDVKKEHSKYPNLYREDEQLDLLDNLQTKIDNEIERRKKEEKEYE